MYNKNEEEEEPSPEILPSQLNQNQNNNQNLNEIENQNIENKINNNQLQSPTNPNQSRPRFTESKNDSSRIKTSQNLNISKVSKTNSRCSYLKDYTKVYQITKISTKPNNYWNITDGIIERQIKYASFMRNAYEVTLVSEKDEMEIERAIFCVDSYTGNVIGGREMSD